MPIRFLLLRERRETIGRDYTPARGGVGMGGEGEGIRFFDCGLTASAQNDNQKKRKADDEAGLHRRYQKGKQIPARGG